MENLEQKEKIELSIRKKFHKELFSKFAKAINEYDLIKPNDKIGFLIDFVDDGFCYIAHNKTVLKIS